MVIILNNWAGLELIRGNYARCDTLLQRAWQVNALYPENNSNTTLYNQSALLAGALVQYAVQDSLAQLSLQETIAEFGDRHSKTITNYGNLSTNAYNIGKYALSDSLSNLALAIAEQTLGKESTEYAYQIWQYAVSQENQGNIALANSLYQQAGSLIHKTYGSNHIVYARYLGNYGMYETLKGNFAKSDTLLQEALALQEATFGKGHYNTAKAIRDLGSLAYSKGEYDKASTFLKEALRLVKATLKESHPDVHDFSTYLADVDFSKGNYATALDTYKAALQVRFAAFGRTTPSDIPDFQKIGEIHLAQGNYESARMAFDTMQQIVRKFFHEQHHYRGSAWCYLGITASEQGNFVLADSLMQLGLSNIKTAFGNPYSIKALEFYTKQATLLRKMGRYPQAQAALENGYKSAKYMLPTKKSVLDLNIEAATLAFEQFEYAKADTILKNAITRYETINPQHVDLAPALTQQAILYTAIGRKDEALQLYERAKEIVRAVNPKHPQLALIEAALASHYIQQKEIAAATTAIQAALAIDKATLSEQHLQYLEHLRLEALCLLNDPTQVDTAKAKLKHLYYIAQGNPNRHLGNYLDLLVILFEVNKDNQKEHSKASEYLQESKRLIREYLGEQHPSMTAWQFRELELRLVLKHFDGIENLVNKAVTSQRQHLIAQFSFLTEQEKLYYLGQQVPNLELLYRLCDTLDAPSIRQQAYEQTAFFKNIVQYSTRNLRQLVEQSENANVKSVFKQLLNQREELGKLYERPDRNTDQVKALEKSTANLENELQRLLPEYRAIITDLEVDLKTLKVALDKDDALVEWVAYHQPQKGRQYAALILRAEDEAPLFVHACSEADFKKTLLYKLPKDPRNDGENSDYINSLYKNTSSKGITSANQEIPIGLYNHLKAPLDTLLNSKIIYSASTELLHRINFSAIKIDETNNNRILYRLKWHNLNSTRDLMALKARPADLAIEQAILMGGINYEYQIDSINAASSNYAQQAEVKAAILQSAVLASISRDNINEQQGKLEWQFLNYSLQEVINSNDKITKKNSPNRTENRLWSIRGRVKKTFEKSL